MKQKNPKVVYICCFPALALAVAVMLYLVMGKNRTDDAVFLYGGLTFAGAALLLYLLAGRRISAREAAKAESRTTPAPEKAAAAPAPAAASPAAPDSADGTDRIDLRKELTGEEFRILLSDLRVAADQLPAEQNPTVTALAGELDRTGTIPAAVLPVCITAVEAGLGVFSAFGIAPAGHGNLLEKLKKLEESK